LFTIVADIVSRVNLLAICRPIGCTVASGVVVGVCNRSQMRNSKCTCLTFGVSILQVLTLARNAQNEFLIGQNSRSHVTYRRPSLDGF